MGNRHDGHRGLGHGGLGHRGWFAISMTIGGRPRTLAPAPWLCLLITIAVPLVAAWSLGTTVFVVFHDQLLATLITRQTDMQYAYEDRIADLRTQLDRETSRGLVDHHTLETTVRELADRSALLEQRATTLDRLLATHTPRAEIPAFDQARATATRNPLLARPRGPASPNEAEAYSGADDSGAPRLEPDPPIANPRPRADNDLGADLSGLSVAIAASLSRVDSHQEQALVALREPTLRSIARLRAALADIRLPVGIVEAASRGATADVGGPYVPLTAAQAGGFEQNAALLQDALAQADRLQALVAKVPLRKPLSGDLEVSSTFGPRLDPFLGRPAMHTGIDFRETYGDSVHATAAGTVTIAGSDGGYGTMVEIDHGNGLTTRYAHLSSVAVGVNKKVAAGDVVGHVGSSGRATGPHLHYETRINGEPVDPTRFLKVGARLYGD